jgi:hypothetical protein
MVIDDVHEVKISYGKLFMADNDKFKNEIIWAINCDGLKTSAYGNTTFFVHAACGDDASEYGVGGGWYGYRATKGLADKFDNNIVKVDTSVFNASRITKVVGTIARKGIESEGRPYRKACML